MRGCTCLRSSNRQPVCCPLLSVVVIVVVVDVVCRCCYSQSCVHGCTCLRSSSQKLVGCLLLLLLLLSAVVVVCCCCLPSDVCLALIRSCTYVLVLRRLANRRCNMVTSMTLHSIFHPRFNDRRLDIQCHRYGRSIMSCYSNRVFFS
jgi:hypothetical protein